MSFLLSFYKKIVNKGMNMFYRSFPSVEKWIIKCYRRAKDKYGAVLVDLDFCNASE